MKKLIPFICLVLCLASFPVHAVDFNFNVEEIANAGGMPYCKYYNNVTGWTDYGSNTSSLMIGGNNGTGDASLDNIHCRHISDDVRTQDGDIGEMYVRFAQQTNTVTGSANFDFQGALAAFLWQDDGAFRGLAYEQVGEIHNTTSRYVYFRFLVRIYGSQNYLGVPLNVNNSSQLLGITAKVVSWNIYRPVDPNADYSSVLNSINSSVASMNSRLDTLSQLQQDTIDAISDTSTSIDDAAQAEQDRYEQDKQEQSDKEDELESQADDLNISAETPTNPFEEFFHVDGCAELPTISTWFHTDSVIRVCSPYPDEMTPIISFVTSTIVVGFLLMIYMKYMKGGYNS